MPDRQTNRQFPLEVGQANCPATRCMQQIKGHRLPSALSQSAIERAIFSLSPHSIRHAPAQLQLELALQLQLGFGSADLHSKKKGHFISNCFLSRIALDGALKIPFRHKRFALRRRSTECDRDGNRQSLSVCVCVDLVNPV